MADISKMVDARDHGYAWVALAAMFFLNVLHSASFATLGIFIVEFLSYFETSKQKITWIGAIQMFVGNIACKFSKTFYFLVVTLIRHIFQINKQIGQLASQFFFLIWIKL